MFVVKGKTSHSKADQVAMMTPVPRKEILGPSKFYSKNLPTDDKEDLEKAIKMSLGQDIDTDLEWALKLSEMDAGTMRNQLLCVS